MYIQFDYLWLLLIFTDNMRVLIFLLITPVTDWMACAKLCDRIYFKHPSEKTFPFVNILNGIYKKVNVGYESFPVYKHMQARVMFTYVSSDHSVGFFVDQDVASAPGLRCSLRITRNEIYSGRWMHLTNKTNPFAEIFSECYLTYGNSKQVKLNYTLTPVCMRNDIVACNGGDVFLFIRGIKVVLLKKEEGKVSHIANRGMFEYYDPPKRTELFFDVSTERWVIALTRKFFLYKTKYKDFALRPEFITSSWNALFPTFFCVSQIYKCSRCKHGECQRVSIEYESNFKIKHHVYYTCSCYFGYKGKYCDKKSPGCAIPEGHEGLIVNTDRYSVASYFCGNLSDDTEPVFFPMICDANSQWKINGTCQYFFSKRKTFYVIVSTGSILLLLLCLLGLGLYLNVSRIDSKWILVYSTSWSLYGFTWVCIKLWNHTSSFEHTRAVVLDSMGYFIIFLSVFINTRICEYPRSLVKPMLGGLGIVGAMVLHRVYLASNNGNISTLLFLVILYCILLTDQYINIRRTRKYLDTLSEGVIRFCEDMARVKPKLKVKISSSHDPSNEEGLNETFSEVIDVPIASWKHKDKVYDFQEPAVWKVSENIVWSENDSEERFHEYLFHLESIYHRHDEQSTCKFELYTPGFKDCAFYCGNKSVLSFSYWSLIFVLISFLHWPLRYKYIICGLREKEFVIEKEISYRSISTAIDNPPPNYEEAVHTFITPPPCYEEATDFDRLLEGGFRPSYEEIMLQTRS